MKTKDFIVLAVLAIAGVIAYVLFGKKNTVAQPATSTTGTAGIGALLFGQPKNGAPSTNPNYAALATAGTGFVNNIYKLFGGGNDGSSQTNLGTITIAPATTVTAANDGQTGGDYFDYNPDMMFGSGSDVQMASLKKKTKKK